MAESGGLENRCTLSGTQGSNPCLSACVADLYAKVILVDCKALERCPSGLRSTLGKRV